MHGVFFAVLSIGFLICGSGMFCMTYVDHIFNPGRRNRNSPDGNRVPTWPMHVAFTLIPLGIVIMAGASVWKNHLPK
jgi:hypothetical protein